MSVRERDGRRRRGSALVEFALLAFVVWLILAGVLELGRAFSAQQILQHAARTIAREMSLLELPHDASFDEALRAVFDTRFLVIDANLLARCGKPLFGEPGHDAGVAELFVEQVPIGNRLLRPLMIHDQVGELRMIRYPGAVLARTDGVSASSPCPEGSVFTVGIAELDRPASRIRWRAVVSPEPVPGDPAATPGRDDYALEAGGWAGVRVRYPFQSAALLASRETGVVDPATGRMTRTLVDVDGDGALVDTGLESLDASLLPPGAADDALSSLSIQAYAGPRGLGRLFSLPDGGGEARSVRPYRRLLSAVAGFRRETFLPAVGGS